MATKKIQEEVFICNRCTHKWRNRAVVKPKICPKCKSNRWNDPLMIKSKKKALEEENTDDNLENEEEEETETESDNSESSTLPSQSADDDGSNVLPKSSGELEIVTEKEEKEKEEHEYKYQCSSCKALFDEYDDKKCPNPNCQKEFNI